MCAVYDVCVRPMVHVCGQKCMWVIYSVFALWCVVHVCVCGLWHVCYSTCAVVTACDRYCLFYKCLNATYNEQRLHEITKQIKLESRDTIILR